MQKVRYMMATKATHNLGDISRDEPELCYIFEDSETDYIGRWATGFGFVNVKFPKETTRELTEHEMEEYRHVHIGISGRDMGTAIP